MSLTEFSVPLLPKPLFEENHVFADFAGLDATPGNPVAQGAFGDFEIPGRFFVVHGLHVNLLQLSSINNICNLLSL